MLVNPVLPRGGRISGHAVDVGILFDSLPGRPIGLAIPVPPTLRARALGTGHKSVFICVPLSVLHTCLPTWGLRMSEDVFFRHLILGNANNHFGSSARERHVKNIAGRTS